MDTTINLRDDLVDKITNGAFLGEVPFLDEKNNDSKVFQSPSDRNVLAESFRMVASNLRYILPKKENGNIILTTSSVKGEGKTFAALNVSLALASLSKKVLIIGADLRNPQLHKYLNISKDVFGLTNYLVDSSLNWRDNIISYNKEFPSHYFLLSGALPPNPLQLLNNGNFEKLLNEASKEFDFVIIDTAPTLLVSDTSNILPLVDTVLYLFRSNVTEKDLINHVNELVKSKKITNVGLLLNGVGSKNRYGYSYTYQYKYSYKYNYSYNYGYGYGYGESES